MIISLIGLIAIWLTNKIPYCFFSDWGRLVANFSKIAHIIKQITKPLHKTPMNKKEKNIRKKSAKLQVR
jgi:hypothetical protein